MLLSNVLQLPEKTWTPDVNPVIAAIMIVGQYTQQTDPFPQFVQQVQLKDDSGVSSEVKIQTKFEKGLLAPNMVGRKARWRLKWYQGAQKQVIVGYCLDKLDAVMDTTQTQPAATPQPAQAPSQPLQQPIAAQPAPNLPQPRDYDAENRGKIRHGIVCAYISAGVDPNIQTVDYWTAYIMTGTAPIPPAKEQLGEYFDQSSQQEPPWES